MTGDALPNDRCCEPIQGWDPRHGHRIGERTERFKGAVANGGHLGWSTGSFQKLVTPQECRKDKELVLKAVKKDVGSLQFAPQEQWIGLQSTGRLFLQWILDIWVLFKSQVNMPAMTRLTSH